ncbi:hypothetical protein Taro_019107 [Colocasia esculenta]|uniref:1-acylglycerol-3-phosphate O-acyltransferase n=1 Tax=Colocasia esculenta TaxID=4460 RepID=A0A843USJ6_COLES|nr:hypothetical protein [Colocasia esculenta]
MHILVVLSTEEWKGTSCGVGNANEAILSCSEQKCIRNQKFAAENGLPILKNVLLPKTRGFHVCLETLRCSLDAVYDITVGYKHRCPTFMDNVFGVDPSEVHLHVKRFRPHEIPSSENDTGAWLMERFKIKDTLLSDFTVQGHFPAQVIEGDLSTLKYLLSPAIIIALTCTCTYFTISSLWFKVYIIASCIYLTSATYFNIRPSSVVASLKALLSGPKYV